MKRSKELAVHFARLTVRPKTVVGSGSDIYKVEDLVDAEYLVLATFVHRYSDGSEELCFLLKAPDGTISKRACCNFKVIQIDGD